MLDVEARSLPPIATFAISSSMPGERLATNSPEALRVTVTR